MIEGPTGPEGGSRLDQPLVQQAIDRAVAERYRAAADDVERIIEATYRVVERQGTVDPRVRDILEEAGLSTEAFYRHFAGKDALLVVLVADGRHRLAGYLEHQMAKAPDPLGAVRSWIEGVLTQAVDPQAAARTRPFVASLPRLAESFPAELEASVAALVRLLERAVAAAAAAGQCDSADPERDAAAVYQLAISVMEAHLLARTSPDAAEVEHLVRFSLRGLGVPRQSFNSTTIS
jgi:AcrR family transcriptional regulator